MASLGRRQMAMSIKPLNVASFCHVTHIPHQLSFKFAMKRLVGVPDNEESRQTPQLRAQDVRENEANVTQEIAVLVARYLE